MEVTCLESGRRSGSEHCFLKSYLGADQYSNPIAAWAGMIRVDGTLYVWMGDPLPGVDGVHIANQTSYTYTSTQSVFSIDAGPVTVNATFLSPLYPNDLQRQSLVFSYVEVAVESNDGSSHDVQLYVDISAGEQNTDETQEFC